MDRWTERAHRRSSVCPSQFLSSGPLVLRSSARGLAQQMARPQRSPVEAVPRLRHLHHTEMPSLPTRARRWRAAFVAGALVVQAPLALAQAHITSPKEQFGFNIGDDYRLVNYTQYVEYLKKLDAQSERMTVVEIGKTE